MSKTVCIIPAYNEEKNIARVIQAVKDAKGQRLLDEIIVVSDGSTDHTIEIAKSYQPDKLIELAKNKGKGFAVIEGIKNTDASFILLLDADLINLTVEHIRQILQPLKGNQADMVVGYFRADLWQNLLPLFSGQRVLSREIANFLINDKKLAKSGYNFEILLNRLVGKNGLKTLYVPLTELSHLTKRQKYSFWRIFISRARFSLSMTWFYKKIPLLIGAVILAFFIYLIFWGPISQPKFLLSPLSVPAKNQHVLIIVAHPDDETIGSGGYIHEVVQNGTKVYVVIITNGDANKFSAAREQKNLFPKSSDFIKEAQIRMQESKAALKMLGMDENNIIFLGFPDRELLSLFKKNWHEPLVSRYTKLSKTIYQGLYKENIDYTGANLNEVLQDLIEKIKPDIIITHYEKDHNDDHRAVAEFVKMATKELTQREVITKPLVYSFLVHWKISEYPHPLRYLPQSPLYPPKDLVSKCEWRTFPLPESTELLKKQAINTYKSQLLSPYLKKLLFAFVRANECFCVETF